MPGRVATAVSGVATIKTNRDFDCSPKQARPGTALEGGAGDAVQDEQRHFYLPPFRKRLKISIVPRFVRSPSAPTIDDDKQCDASNDGDEPQPPTT